MKRFVRLTMWGVAIGGLLVLLAVDEYELGWRRHNPTVYIYEPGIDPRGRYYCQATANKSGPDDLDCVSWDALMSGRAHKNAPTPDDSHDQPEGRHDL